MARTAEERRAYGRAYYAANRERLRLKCREFRRKLRKAEPEKVKAYKNAWRAANKKKVAISETAWRHKNADKIRAAKRMRYKKRNKEAHSRVARLSRGLPSPTRPQPKYCEACCNPASGKNMHLDHCHKTGYFRGWLCSNCNTGIGLLGDNLAGVRLAAAYLQRHTRRVVIVKDDESYLE